MILNQPKFRHSDFILYRTKKSSNQIPKTEYPPINPDYIILDENNRHVLNIYQFDFGKYTVKNLNDEFQFNIRTLRDLRDLFPEYKIILP